MGTAFETGAPFPLREGPGRGACSGRTLDPHPQSLPSRGREAQEPKPSTEPMIQTGEDAK